MSDLTPRSIIGELDKYIIGQNEAKKAVAIALCNRERRKRLSPEMRHEVIPKNILMIGPTGVGKTEIARRLAAIVNAPFLKVEATKFTEVGYVGRDVESIIHDLAEVSANKVYHEELKEIESKAKRFAMERIAGYLCQQLRQRKRAMAKGQQAFSGISKTGKTTIRLGDERDSAITRRRVMALLRNQRLEEQFIEIEVDNGGEGIGSIIESPMEIDLVEVNPSNGFYRGLRSYVGQRKRKVRVKEARRILIREEANKLLDFDQVVEQAINRVEEDGIVFIDELDKLIGPKVDIGRDISGEGVQRDILPLLDGTTVMTRYGMVKTEHILFIAAGTFPQNKPSELIPELQGRLPLRVELSPFSQHDLERILTEPHNSLIRQYQALLATEGIDLVFTEDGVREIARLVALMNERSENIGARRLYTIMEKLLEDLSFAASERRGEQVVVDADYVFQQIGGLIKDENLSRYIL
ncbi:MAG TPA: ATP-dependent protease ATPase subunit HslU [Dehalococcoidia bacterium]|nr:ATP-dependent protease ATPase subunit HslU [Dehalococcoidia bacterium]